ncbi:MAG: hypothetical protein JG781_957 [Peptococcaceae bacterium]|uniref:MoaD/ThiS family protein n=1 Tax=Thermanaerosceptrum fracticalcis TaxID=1712410 RepID=A0A7G6E2N0_THEFR|nr:MoaD/ThiS family protein [Thermanaerosceptrum fracticalcis]MBZ4653618.1 hypothetical protein [Peptococcaceae bacterium]QNB46334.1 hypothetical protein BR63_08410 [Thermanaerosceptrum fracticalcis]
MQEKNKNVDVKVRFLGGLEDGLPIKDHSITVTIKEPLTTYHLLDTLIEDYPLLRSRLKNQGELAPDLMIVVNGVVTREDIPLQQGDEVLLMYIGVGG